MRVQPNIGFVSKSQLKVRCVNLKANGILNSSLIFSLHSPATGGVFARLISCMSLEVL